MLFSGNSTASPLAAKVPALWRKIYRDRLQALAKSRRSREDVTEICNFACRFDYCAVRMAMRFPCRAKK
jgi:hypothetical protein